MCGLPTIRQRFTLSLVLVPTLPASAHFAFQNAKAAGSTWFTNWTTPVDELAPRRARTNLSMEPKRSKYDTNPLDEKVADRATESFASKHADGDTGPVSDRRTRDVKQPVSETARAHPESEAPTRRIDEDLAGSYPSVFIKPQTRPSTTYAPPRPAAANIYQPPPVPPPGIYQRPSLPIDTRARPVAGMGIAEKWVNLLPYIPGHVGAIAAVIELLLVPRTETRARFHAAQGLALQIAILIITGAFQILTAITDSSFGSGLFRAASTVFLIVSMVRVFKGRAHHIAPLDDFTKWLDEKLKPRK